MLLFGHRIPNLATHHPLLMAMKVAAMGRKTYDETGGGLGGALNAIGHGTVETAKEIPFVSELSRGYNFANERSVTKHVKELGKSFVPKEIADRVFPREQKAGKSIIDKNGNIRLPQAGGANLDKMFIK